MNPRPKAYESSALPLSYSGNHGALAALAPALLPGRILSARARKIRQGIRSAQEKIARALGAKRNLLRAVNHQRFRHREERRAAGPAGGCRGAAGDDRPRVLEALNALKVIAKTSPSRTTRSAPHPDGIHTNPSGPFRAGQGCSRAEGWQKLMTAGVAGRDSLPGRMTASRVTGSASARLAFLRRPVRTSPSGRSSRRTSPSRPWCCSQF